MELDNFRGQWQRQPTTGLPVTTLSTAKTLHTMLTSHTSSNPLLRLKKNASQELKLVSISTILLVSNVLLFSRHGAEMQWFMASILGVVCLVGLLIYQRLKLIRQMEQQQADLYQFLKTRITKFRQLMRLHDYVSVVTLALLAVVALLIRRADLRAFLQADQPGWGWHVGAVGAGAVLLLALIYAAYAMGRKEHQRRYGRYLDQLEAAMRELDETA